MHRGKCQLGERRKEQSKQRKIVVKLEMRNKQQTNLKIREEMEM